MKRKTYNTHLEKFGADQITDLLSYDPEEYSGSYRISVIELFTKRLMTFGSIIGVSQGPKYPYVETATGGVPKKSALKNFARFARKHLC